MNAKSYERQLAGGDLRSIGKANLVLSRIKNQKDFDMLYKCLSNSDRLVVMRAADTIEKITRAKSNYLFKYKPDILRLCESAKDKELKWHLAQLLPRCQFKGNAFKKAWNLLKNWSQDPANSRIVRVNAIQSFFEMSGRDKTLISQFRAVILNLEKENIPSINARIKMLKEKSKFIHA